MSISREDWAARFRAIRDGSVPYEPQLCGGCTPAGRCQLGLVCTSHDHVVSGTATAPPSWEGAPGIAHGGWVTAVFDDLLGHVAVARGHAAVTKSMTVEFLRPVPVAREVTLSTHVERVDERRHWHLRASMHLGPDELARASGIWAERDPDRHFARKDAWLAGLDGDPDTPF